MTDSEEKGVRLQKFLASAGVCSRRAGEEMILSGLVKVNGKTITELGTRIDPEKDVVLVKGKNVTIQDQYVYIALNKPAGFVTSCSHPGEKIVLDLVNAGTRIFPVGRLDKDSTGLLILTNDGRIHHRLSHPSFDHEKEYEVTVKKEVTDSELKQMETGIILEGRMTRPARVIRLSYNSFNITLKEGRNRQIRKMAECLGHKVTRLHRIRFSDIRIGSLEPGNWRYLSELEKKALLLKLGLSITKEKPHNKNIKI
ncbi:pseudouridine synthase [Desulforegula conservatrix]|uniref:pseudouridine synthase n=1 Tax=Desulforegula conservatrix TaxID=153026 RepID=UPI00041FEBFE|nr:pseudouridine synthase [Desulforegula conservatrix]